MKTVLVFKTSVATEQEVRKLRPVLNNLIRPDEKWNFDLEDRDRVLRVETALSGPSDIIERLTDAGYLCMELED